MSQEYLRRLTKDAIKWQLITHPTKNFESWYPSWGPQHNKFLVLLSETLATRSIPVKRSKTYYIYCCGMDDEEMAIRDLSWSDAKRIYHQIVQKDLVSKDDLKKLGFQRD